MQCTLYTVLHTVQCTVYSVQCIIYDCTWWWGRKNLTNRWKSWVWYKQGQTALKMRRHRCLGLLYQARTLHAVHCTVYVVLTMYNAQCMYIVYNTPILRTLRVVHFSAPRYYSGYRGTCKTYSVQCTLYIVCMVAWYYYIRAIYVLLYTGTIIYYALYCVQCTVYIV